VTASGSVVLAADLELPPQASGLVAGGHDVLELGFHAAVANLERALLEQALTEAGGNRSKAAELLKMRRQLFCTKLKEHKMDNAH
jgi:DNA-binding NtrC family response regulator